MENSHAISAALEGPRFRGVYDDKRVAAIVCPRFFFVGFFSFRLARYYCRGCGHVTSMIGHGTFG